MNDQNPAGDVQDPAEPYEVDVNVDTTPAGEDSDDTVDTVDETKVETDDVTVTETHAESPSES